MGVTVGIGAEVRVGAGVSFSAGLVRAGFHMASHATETTMCTHAKSFASCLCGGAEVQRCGEVRGLRGYRGVGVRGCVGAEVRGCGGAGASYRGVRGYSEVQAREAASRAYYLVGRHRRR